MAMQDNQGALLLEISRKELHLILYISARRIDWSQNYFIVAIRFANLTLKAGKWVRTSYVNTSIY